MPLIVRAFPLRRPQQELTEFAARLNELKSETAAFYRQFGVTHESWHLQETPSGPWVIGVTRLEQDATDAGRRYAASEADFEAWFKGTILRLSGVNPDTEPLGPPTSQVFVWCDEARPSSNLCE